MDHLRIDIGQDPVGFVAAHNAYDAFYLIVFKRPHKVFSALLGMFINELGPHQSMRGLNHFNAKYFF